MSHRFWRIVQLSEKQLPTNPAVGRLKHIVEEVKLTVPVVADLRSETLTEKHWEELHGVLGVNMKEKGAVTFKDMLKVKPNYWTYGAIDSMGTLRLHALREKQRLLETDPIAVLRPWMGEGCSKFCFDFPRPRFGSH